MAKQKRQDPGVWSRLMLWVKQNEKVLFVLLLGAICFTFAFGDVVRQILQSGRSSDVQLGFDRSIGPDEFQSKSEIYPKAIAFGRPILLTDDAPTLQLNSDGSFNVRELLIYRGIALAEGIRVSDEELQTEIKRLWRRYAATEKAVESLEKRNRFPQGPSDYGYSFELQSNVEKNTRFLEQSDIFDPENYSELVRTRTGLHVKVFESALRDLLLIKRLGQYVASTVALDPKDIYEEYKSESQRRKLRWLSVEVPDEEKKKLEESITEEDIKEYYNKIRRSSRTQTRLRFRWLRGDREPFVEAIAKEVTDEKLEEFYREDRQQYLEAGLFPNIAGFTLLTDEQKEARDAKRYKPFDEVKEEVKRRYIRKKSNERLKGLALKLRLRLYPVTPSPGTKAPPPTPAVSFETLAEELDTVTAGYTEFSTKQAVTDTFGEIYGEGWATAIARWLDDADKNRSYVLSDSNQSRLKSSKSAPDEVEDDVDADLKTDKFFVFVTDVEIRGPGIPSLEEMRNKVVEKLVNQKLNDLVVKAIDDRVKKIDDGDEKFADEAKGSLEVALEGGDTFTATFGEIEGSGKLFVRKGSRSIMVPEKPDETKKKKEGDEENDPNDTKEVAHDSSKALSDAVFALVDPGDVGAARDDENGISYLVEFVDRLYPDPGEFKIVRSRVERLLAEKRRQQVFSAWRDKVYAEGDIKLPGTDQGETSS